MFNIQLLLNLFKLPSRRQRAKSKVNKSLSMFAKAHKSIEQANEILNANIVAHNMKLSRISEERKRVSSEISENFASLVENRNLQEQLKQFIPKK